MTEKCFQDHEFVVKCINPICLEVSDWWMRIRDSISIKQNSEEHNLANLNLSNMFKFDRRFLWDNPFWIEKMSSRKNILSGFEIKV